MERLQAVFLLGTLKKSPEISHTDGLCALLSEEFQKHGTASEMIRLADYDIKPGITTEIEGDDDWPALLEKVLASDIVVFATPIWWGQESSLLRRVVERMDELNEHILQTGESELANKVGGIVITGAEDGAQHVIGNLCNFMAWNGLTMPPASSLSYLGSFPGKTKEELLSHFKQQESTANMAKTVARNLCFMANLLKSNPLPADKSASAQNISPGRA